MPQDGVGQGSLLKARASFGVPCLHRHPGSMTCSWTKLDQCLACLCLCFSICNLNIISQGVGRH